MPMDLNLRSMQSTVDYEKPTAEVGARGDSPRQEWESEDGAVCWR